MKHFLTFFLAFVLLTESLLPKGMGLSQDFKFGEVISHYQEHKDTAKESFNFLDFLWMHYAADSTHKQQHHHDKLPCLDGHNLLTIIDLPTQLVLLIEQVSLAFFDEISPLNYLNSYHFLFSLDVLNPPK